MVLRPAYNMQIISTPEHQVIVAVDIDTSGSDRGLARPGIETAHAEGYTPSNYLVDGGFTKHDDIEWAHAKDIKMWCPPGQTRHGTDTYAPKKDDGVGVADWRERMKCEEDKKGEAIYRLRAEHECINAHARRMGLRQLSLRGKIKARIHLLWFAVARNMMRRGASAALQTRNRSPRIWGIHALPILRPVFSSERCRLGCRPLSQRLPFLRRA
jgi:Transposase DDE domain